MFGQPLKHVPAEANEILGAAAGNLHEEGGNKNSDRTSHAVLMRLENSEDGHRDKTIDINVYLKCFVHELRTPLASMSMMIDLLQQEPDTGTETNPEMKTKTNMDRAELFQDLHSNFVFIDKILTKFSVIEDSRIQLNPFEPFSLKTKVENVQRLIPRTPEFARVRFDTYIHPNIHPQHWGDRYNLKHVIINLLKNAVKYQTPAGKSEKRGSQLITINVVPQSFVPRGGEPNTQPASVPFGPLPKAPLRLSVPLPLGEKKARSNTFSHAGRHLHATEFSDTKSKSTKSSKPQDSMFEDIRIEVCDTNPHILPHIKTRLFETFNSTSGSGLGLYICKTIIELHGGSISHEYTQPVGNKFIINLTLQQYHPDIALPVSNPHRRRSRQTYGVAILDDDSLNCKLMCKVIGTQSIFSNIESYTDPSLFLSDMAAAAAAQQSNIDLCFVDKYMPAMDGTEVVRRLRDQGYSNLVFGLTGSECSQDRHALLAAGADMVLTKPLTMSILVQIMALLAKHGPPSRWSQGHTLTYLDGTIMWQQNT
jgi:signal transduction histidine kinase/CheY-like chemotaxis protein